MFLNSGTNASSHNANASYARHSTRDAGLASEEGEPTSLREPLNPADPDPFRGSAFSRSVLVALGNKLLMKAALGVFAAGAALARARRAYCARVWRRNAAAPARAALAALGDAARRARENERKADAHHRRVSNSAARFEFDTRFRSEGLFFEDDSVVVTFTGARATARAWFSWRANVAARADRRNKLALAAASRTARAARGAFGQWRVAVLERERAAHVGSLALSFRRRRALVAATHAWRDRAGKSVTARLKMLAATPSKRDERSKALRDLESRVAARSVATKTKTPEKERNERSSAAERLSAALEACVAHFVSAPRRVAAVAAAARVAELVAERRRAFAVTDADARWIALASPRARARRAQAPAGPRGDGKRKVEGHERRRRSRETAARAPRRERGGRDGPIPARNSESRASRSRVRTLG